MWNPAKTPGAKTFDTTLNKAQGASTELQNFDNELNNSMTYTGKDLAEAQNLNNKLNSAVNRRVELLGDAVKNGTPWGVSMIATAESSANTKGDPVFDREERIGDVTVRDEELTRAKARHAQNVEDLHGGLDYAVDKAKTERNLVQDDKEAATAE